jgi:hypothetical protein
MARPPESAVKIHKGVGEGSFWGVTTPIPVNVVAKSTKQFAETRRKPLKTPSQSIPSP